MLYKTSKLAEKLWVTEKTVYRWIKLGYIVPEKYRVGHSYVFSKENIQKFLKEHPGYGNPFLD